MIPASIKCALQPHASYVPVGLSVGCNIQWVGSDVLKLEYVVVGRISSLLIPNILMQTRRDELWKHTCFELFAGFDGYPMYVEYNFSPSTEWSGYRFDDYRSGMSPDVNLAAPHIYLDFDVQAGIGRFALTAWLDMSGLVKERLKRIGISAVIEEKDSTKSYWALAHPPGPPDFHHPDCFTLQLKAPERP
jgi:hypothetical protein